MDESQQISPLRILRENISILEVARYYLAIEFSKLFKNVSPDLINEAIMQQQDKDVWPLLQAISFTYHLNGVFNKLSREGYQWNEEIWHVKDLLMTGMDSNVNKVIFNDRVKGDSLKFKEYLVDYFNTHQKDDPEKLFSYKTKSVDIIHKKIIATKEGSKLKMLDGSHRLTEMLLHDINEVQVYVGHLIKSQEDNKKRIRVGGSTLILMSILYKKSEPSSKESVLTVVKEIMKNSIDGREAVKKYWVDQMFWDDDIKTAGKFLLSDQ